MGKPRAPDPARVAAAQAQANRETAITQTGLNAMDQFNPYGSVTYAQDGTWADGTPRFQQTTTFSPEQQAIFDQTQQAQGNLAGIAADQSAFLQNYLNEPFSFTNDDAAQWAYDLASPRILQQQGQNEAQLRSTLAAKGIREGTAAWNSEMGRMTNANTDQLNQLALTGRGQAFAEALAGRNQPINEITALMSGSQVSNPAAMSSPTPQTGVAGTDVAGIYQQDYQNRLGAAQGMWGGIGGLFGTAMSAGLFSDRRLKTDIRRVGQTDGGLPIYVYRYGGAGPFHMGVMADEVSSIIPDAVVSHDSGYDMVLYSEVR